LYEVVRDNLQTLYGAIGDGAIADPANVARYLAAVGEATEVPPRSPGRGPPYWKSCLLRRQALGEVDDGQGPWVQETA
jgi:hypothetical protein